MVLHTMLVYRNQHFCTCRVHTRIYSLRMAVAGGQLSCSIFTFSCTDIAVHGLTMYSSWHTRMYAFLKKCYRKIGSQQGWSCWQFQCIESICTKMQTFLFRKAREQLRYDGGIEPSCAWRWFYSIPCQPSCSAVWWGWIFLDFGSKKQQQKMLLTSL